MHGVTGVMTALVMRAVSVGEDPVESTSLSALGQGRTFVGVAVPLAPSGFALEAERELDDLFSATLGLRASFNLGKWIPALEDSDSEYLLLGVEHGMRFYLTGSALDGLWIGPRLELGHVWRGVRIDSPQGHGFTHRGWEVGGSLLSGYSMRLDKGFTVQGSLGVGATYQPGFPGFNSWAVIVDYRAQLSLGWSF